MKKTKVSELPICTDLKGLYTLGVNNKNESVRVSLEFVETKTDAAVQNAETAANAAYVARDNAVTATTAANDATTKSKQATQTCNTATENAKEATRNCDASIELCKNATSQSTTQTELAKTATKNADDATAAALAAAKKAGDDTAAAIKKNDDATAAAIQNAETAINADIAKNDAATEQAVNKATAATEDATKATALVNDTMHRLIPQGMTVEAPTHLTRGNVQPNYIQAHLQPENTLHNVIYISDNKAVDVDTDGRLTIVGKGNSKVHVIPTCNTALAKTINISVTDPTIRLGDTHGQMRLTSTGAIRFN